MYFNYYFLFSMGPSNSHELRVLSLNYSGIFLSPFEFYGVNNWQELQQIGIIFQRNLKQKYPDITKIVNKDKMNSPKRQELEKPVKYKSPNKLDPINPDGKEKESIIKQDKLKAQKQIKPLPKIYDKSTKIWDIITGMEKVTKKQRYSPLYLLTKEPNNLYAGIKDGRLQSQDEFNKTWDNYYYEAQKKSKSQNKNQSKSYNYSQQQIIICRIFDFLCYKSLVEYFFNKQDKQPAIYFESFNSEIKFKNVKRDHNNLTEIIQMINQVQFEEYYKLSVDAFSKFLQSYFAIIDEKTKIQKTVEYIFKKQKLSIINLQEVTSQFRKEVVYKDESNRLCHKFNDFYIYESIDSSDQNLLMIRKDLPILPNNYERKYQTWWDHSNSVKQKVTDIFLKIQQKQIQQEKRKQFGENIKKLVTLLKDYFSREINANWKIQSKYPLLRQKRQFHIQLKSNIQVITITIQQGSFDVKITSLEDNAKQLLDKFKVDPKQQQSDKQKNVQKQQRPYSKFEQSSLEKQKILKPLPIKFEDFIKKFKLLICGYLFNPIKYHLDLMMEKYTYQFVRKWSQKIIDKQSKNFLNEIKQAGLLFWSEAFAIAPFIENKTIVACTHFSSKAEKNAMQAEIFGILIYELANHGYKYIFSGDYNRHISIRRIQKEYFCFSFLNDFNETNKNAKIVNELQDESKTFIFPRHPKVITTKKKRTILQAQSHKSNTLAEKSIDLVISNFKIAYDKCSVGQLDDLGSCQFHNKSYLPHTLHPYDHYAVEAIVCIGDEQQAK